MLQPLASNLAQTFCSEGYTIVPNALESRTIDGILTALAPLAAGMSQRGGIRHLLRDIPAIRDLIHLPHVRAIAEMALGPRVFAVRGILFDKTPNANWKVIWHQDLTITVRERREVEGFGPWSKKGGVIHVQPPTSILERMVAIRLHLDDCTESNGPVRVIPGSHRAGRLDSTEIVNWRARRPDVVCTVPRGGILAFSPLLLHASSPALNPVHRRVVHIEFACDDLPEELTWYERY